MTKSPTRFLAALPLLSILLSLPACIRTEDTRTYYLREDGKIDVVMFLDHVHSSSEKPAEAKKEEAKWLADFRAGKISELTQLKSSEAKAVKSQLLREQAPFAASIRATYDSIADFGKVFDLSTKDPDKRIELARDGKKRTLSFHIAKKPGEKERPRAEPEGNVAEHALHWRFVPVSGQIVAAKACVISADKRSCMLDIAEIDRQDHGPGAIDISLSWVTE